ncbi:hypothetical protein GGD56_005662 [Rhizobium mongolense]|uniref:Uncharacterized protein n=1 Tax=Rhizobium mongolense TaxID=57676 RepID=A0ABR6IVT0_9HYPH|nr:hypothetical protein [Rhizobium mongolense]
MEKNLIEQLIREIEGLRDTFQTTLGALALYDGE